MKNKLSSLKKYLFWLVSAAIVTALIILPFSLEKSSEKASGKASILPGIAEMGSISTTLSGAGFLASEDLIEITVPDGVEITGYNVSNGSVVSEGEPIAYVDKVTVLKSALDLNQTIKKVEEDMHRAEDDLVSGYIYSNGAGTVKNIYASVGDSVRQVMLDHGCLAVVTLENGEELKITGISGIITAVNVETGRNVYNGAKMFTLSNLDSTGEYANLAVLHEKYQDLMAQLYQMYSDGYVKAVSGGMIGNVDKTLINTASFERPLYATLLSHIELLGADRSDTEPVTDYLSGLITSIDSLFQAKISGIPDSCTVDLSAFSAQNPKKGDTVFMKRDTYLFDDGSQAVDYTALLINASQEVDPGKNDKPSGGHSGISGFPFGGISSGGLGALPQVGEDNQEETTFPLEGTCVATVTPTEKMLVSITVDELDILSIRKGDTALVTIDAIPGRSFEGTVTAVNTEGLSENTGEGNSKYYAEITLDRTEEMLDGMNASAIITIDTVDNILTVPVKALCEIGTKTFVFTALDNSGELSDPVEVKTGISDGERVQILSGLKEGSSFWYSFYDTLEIDGKVSGGLFSS